MTKSTSSNKAILECQKVSKTYQDGDRKLEVLHEVTMTIREGEFISIIGQSGSGKSTLLHLMGALDLPTSGQILMQGQNYSGLSSRELANLRRDRIGFIYQFHHLLPEFTAVENTFMPAMIAGSAVPDMISRAEALLHRVGLGERLDHRPTKLSGGEQQRVALARALMNDPDLILADEPTGDLDQTTGHEIMEFVLKEIRSLNKSLVVVTHDPQLAEKADRIFVLENGRLKQRGG